MSPDPARISLGIDREVIEVTSRDVPTLGWLAEFLGPAFRSRRDETGSSERQVSFEVSPRFHSELSRTRASVGLRDLDGFTLDGRFSRHLAWRGRDGRIWAHDANGDTFYGVADGGHSVRVVAERAETYQRVALMRVVRELATIALLRAGRLPLHAAAFVLDDEAVLVAGPKRAGKTSLLVHALRCGGSYLSNDRVFVKSEPRPVAHAMPTIVMLRDGTLSLFGALKRSYEGARFDRGRTIIECAPGVERPEPRAGAGFDRPGISPAQFCRLLCVAMESSAPVRSVLFPRVDPRISGIDLEPLSRAEARAALGRSLLEASSPARYSELFAPDLRGEALSVRARDERCERFLEHVRAFGCRLGRDAFSVDLRDALGRAGATGRNAPPALRPGFAAR